MKIPLRLKVLFYLKRKIETSEKKVSKPVLYAFLFVVWLLTVRSKVIELYNKFISLGLFSFVRNLYFVYCTDKSEARIFTGMFYRWLSVRYADKRANISRVNKLCGGKRHYVIPYDKEALIVINKLEVNRLKSKGMFSKSYNVLDVFENAFYVTK